jgi:hypothetical protein
MLNIVYDLRVMSPSFDFPYFIALADARRREESSEDEFVLWIITGKSKRPASWDWGGALNQVEIEWLANLRLSRVIFPLARLFPNVKKINVIDESSVAALDIPVFHPIGYSFRDPKIGVYHKGWFLLPYAKRLDLRCLVNRAEAISEARRYLQGELDCDNPVIVTTRNNVVSHDQSRNTRPEVLAELLSYLESGGFTVGLIPDTSLVSAFSMPFRGRVLTAPAFDVSLRSAIYECASFCLFEPTGPLVLAQLNPRAKFVAYGMAWSSTFDASYQQQRGYAPDVNFIAPSDVKQQYLWGSLTRDWLDTWIREANIQ